MRNISVSDYTFSVLLNNGNIDCTGKVVREETENSIIWLVNPNEEPININHLETLDNQEKYVHEIEGTWACLIQDKKNKIFRAISSINNELPWYFTETEPYLISNNIFLIIQHLKSYTINYNAIASYLSFDHTFGGETFLNQVTKVYGGDIVYLSNKGIKVNSNDLEKWLGFDNSISDSRVLMDILINEVDKSLRDPYPEIAITGGSDSRVILAAGLQAKKDFVLFTGTATSVARMDIKKAKVIANKLNIDHKTIDAGKREIEDLNEVLDRVTIETNAEFIPRNYIIFYKEYVLAQNTYRGVGRLKGNGGEIYKGFYGNVYKTVARRTLILNKNYRKVVRAYVNNIYMNYFKRNNENSSDLFYQRERAHFWAGSNNRTFLSYCKVYNPFLSPSLLAAGYRVQGGIKNSFLHRNMLSTLPESIQKIPINYSKLEKLIRYFVSSKIKSVVDYNYFLRPHYLRKNIDFELLDPIISKPKINSMIELYDTRGFQDTLLHKIFAVSNFFKIIK